MSQLLELLLEAQPCTGPGEEAKQEEAQALASGAQSQTGPPNPPRAALAEESQAEALRTKQGSAFACLEIQNRSMERVARH